MANQQLNQPASPAIPTPATITPALLKTHSITEDEYARIEKALGRTPSLTELGIFSVMWSEHCSYKSSRVHLKRLPTKGTRLTGPGSVVQGPGENAGIIDVGDGWACAFKIESHNHPSYIEPYQGAATGVGGILRDIFTMGARPLAVMDSLRFGPLQKSPGAPSQAASSLEVGSTDPIDYARNRHTMAGVVHGVGGYGNCFGVPNLGGETRFEDCYSGNPLVNAFALGLVRTDEIFYAKAEGVGNPVFYVGAKTGRDGIHGATMASEEFTEGSEQKRPNVQMGDPFLEKLLLEACLEVMKTGAVLGIQDMGAAGLTCSTCEMGARGSLGVSIELDKVPQRETGMTSYEIMLSESQERMLLVAEKGREQEVLDVFKKWGMDCAEVGVVTADDVMRVYHGGVLQAEIQNKDLTDNAPIYKRPVGIWEPPVPRETPYAVLEALKQRYDYEDALKAMLASANICSKAYIFEQYDSMVQTNTVQGPGGEAGVIRVKKTNSHPILEKIGDLIAESTPRGDAAMAGARAGKKPERGIAMALAGNGRWCYLDPKLGAMHAVAEAARKVACSGATPVAATNCLNFGNPQKPEIMAQLSSAIDGIAEACVALGTPVTGGNVSLYNETLGEGIYPTPVMGIVGIMDDVSKTVPADFQHFGDKVLLLQSATETEGSLTEELGSSDFAKTRFGALWGTPPWLDLKAEAALHRALVKLASRGLIHSAKDVSDGGLAVALAQSCFAKEIGVHVNLGPLGDANILSALFGENATEVVITCAPEVYGEVCYLLDEEGAIYAIDIGDTIEGSFEIFAEDDVLIDLPLAELKVVHSGALEQQLAHKVLA